MKLLYLKIDTCDKCPYLKYIDFDDVSEIIGKWPGDETDEEFDAMMREIEKEREMCEETECVHLGAACTRPPTGVLAGG